MGGFKCVVHAIPMTKAFYKCVVTNAIKSANNQSPLQWNPVLVTFAMESSAKLHRTSCLPWIAKGAYTHSSKIT